MQPPKQKTSTTDLANNVDFLEEIILKKNNSLKPSTVTFPNEIIKKMISMNQIGQRHVQS